MKNRQNEDTQHKSRGAEEASPVRAAARPRPGRTPLHPLFSALLLAVLLAALAWLAFSAGSWLQQTARPADAVSQKDPDDHGLGLPDRAYARLGRLVVGVNDRFTQLNPLYATGDGEIDAVALIFESLFRIDATGQAVGQLAQEWIFSPDSGTLTVTLRQDHTYRDGRVVTADDVVFTYRCLLSEAYDGPYKGWLKGLQQVEAGPDDHTVIFWFTTADRPPDLRLLSVGILKSDYYPYQPERIFELREGNLHPEGSGAFQLVEHSPNRVILQLRPGYAGQIDTIDIQQVASDAKYRLLQEGQLDIVRNTWDARMMQRAHSLSGYAFHPYATSPENYFLLNPRPGSQQIIQRPSQRLAVLLTVAKQPLSRLQEMSLAELPESGLLLYYFQGVDRDVRYSNREKADAIAALLQAAGLEVTLKATAWPELVDRAMRHDYDLLLLPATVNSRLPDLAVLLEDTVQPDASAMVTGYHQEVLIVCKRLSQVTINPYARPFAASVGSWTDRIENIRVLQPASKQEDPP